MNDPIRFVRQPAAWAVALCCAWDAHAQDPIAPTAQDPGALSPVVVLGQRSGGGVWRGAASIDVVDGNALRDGQARINLSEGLNGVPGLVIVNDGNSRFFEPGLGRKLLVGLEAQRRF
jgi:iron complex outermembrane receptor protein